MESEEEFMSLAEAAFSKMKWVELECPDPDESVFTKLAAFLKEDSNTDQLLQTLVKMCAERFSKEPNAPNEHENNTEFLVTCRGSEEVFSVGYEGFWLISLLEAGNDQVTVNLESFKVGGLGGFVYMGVWGDQEELIRFSSHVCRQEKPLSKICLNEARCTTFEEGLAMTKVLENCNEFKVSHVYLYFTESTAEFWTALAVQLKRAPVKILQTASKALLDARMEDLREIWEVCVLETLEIGSVEVQLGEEEGWQKIQDIVAKEEKFRDMIADNLEKFLTRMKDGQGPTCPSGFPLKKTSDSKLHWVCNLCGAQYMMDYPWRCEDCERKECNYDVDRACMVIYAGEESAESIGKRFAEQTGLKFKFAMQLVGMSGLDLEKALAEFNEAKADGEIPPEAYSEA